jgi:hypothetical protein
LLFSWHFLSFSTPIGISMFLRKALVRLGLRAQTRGTDVPCAMLLCDVLSCWNTKCNNFGEWNWMDMIWTDMNSFHRLLPLPWIHLYSAVRCQWWQQRHWTLGKTTIRAFDDWSHHDTIEDWRWLIRVSFSLNRQFVFFFAHVLWSFLLANLRCELRVVIPSDSWCGSVSSKLCIRQHAWTRVDGSILQSTNTCQKIWRHIDMLQSEYLNRIETSSCNRELAFAKLNNLNTHRLTSSQVHELHDIVWGCHRSHWA